MRGFHGRRYQDLAAACKVETRKEKFSALFWERKTHKRGNIIDSSNDAIFPFLCPHPNVCCILALRAPLQLCTSCTSLLGAMSDQSTNFQAERVLNLIHTNNELPRTFSQASSPQATTYSPTVPHKEKENTFLNPASSSFPPSSYIKCA